MCADGAHRWQISAMHDRELACWWLECETYHPDAAATAEIKLTVILALKRTLLKPLQVQHEHTSFT